MTFSDLLALTNGDAFICGLALVGPVGGLILFTILSVSQKRTISARVDEAGGSIILSRFLKEYGYWWLQAPARVLVALEVHPTTVTLGGTAVVLAGALAVSQGHFGLGGLAILLGSLSDMLDGIVARARNLASEAGTFVDSVVDRYADLGVFAGLGAYFCGSPAALGVIAAAAFGATMVSYMRAKAEALGVRDVPKGPMQRAERAVLLGFGIYFAPVVARHSALAGGSFGLPLAVCALIAVVANIWALLMGRYTTGVLRQRAQAALARAAATPGAPADVAPAPRVHHA